MPRYHAPAGPFPSFRGRAVIGHVAAFIVAIGIALSPRLALTFLRFMLFLYALGMGPQF